MVMVVLLRGRDSVAGAGPPASRGKPVTRIRSARRDRRLSPEGLKSIRRKFGVTHRVPDVLVASGELEEQAPSA